MSTPYEQLAAIEAEGNSLQGAIDATHELIREESYPFYGHTTDKGRAALRGVAELQAELDELGERWTFLVYGFLPPAECVWQGEPETETDPIPF